MTLYLYVKLLMRLLLFNPLSANITKSSTTLKQFVGKLPTNCLSVFDHFVGLALKELNVDFETFKKPTWSTYFVPIIQDLNLHRP